MYISEKDYQRIEQYLANRAIKDTQFENATTPLSGTELIPAIQEGENRLITLNDIAGLATDAIRYYPLETQISGDSTMTIDGKLNWLVYTKDNVSTLSSSMFLSPLYDIYKISLRKKSNPQTVVQDLDIYAIYEEVQFQPSIHKFVGTCEIDNLTDRASLYVYRPAVKQEVGALSIANSLYNRAQFLELLGLSGFAIKASSANDGLLSKDDKLKLDSLGETIVRKFEDSEEYRDYIPGSTTQPDDLRDNQVVSINDDHKYLYRYNNKIATPIWLKPYKVVDLKNGKPEVSVSYDLNKDLYYDDVIYLTESSQANLYNAWVVAGFSDDLARFLNLDDDGAPTAKDIQTLVGILQGSYPADLETGKAHMDKLADFLEAENRSKLIFPQGGEDIPTSRTDQDVQEWYQKISIDATTQILGSVPRRSDDRIDYVIIANTLLNYILQGSTLSFHKITDYPNPTAKVQTAFVTAPENAVLKINGKLYIKQEEGIAPTNNYAGSLYNNIIDIITGVIDVTEEGWYYNSTTDKVEYYGYRSLREGELPPTLPILQQELPDTLEVTNTTTVSTDPNAAIKVGTSYYMNVNNTLVELDENATIPADITEVRAIISDTSELEETEGLVYNRATGLLENWVTSQE